jgi:hypothetical protein
MSISAHTHLSRAPLGLDRGMSRLLAGLGLVWFTAVVIGSTSGLFASLYMPWIAAIVAATIGAPTVWYFVSPRLQHYMAAVGHRRIALFHIWRVPAALLFFWYGAKGELPTVFWVFAGTGDFIAGVLAWRVARQPEQSAAAYRAFHRFGFADFVAAVGAGLTFTLLQDPRMAPIAALPMSLIPLFGVGISGATHLMAFDMLRRGVGLAQEAHQAPQTRAAEAHG